MSDELLNRAYLQGYNKGYQDGCNKIIDEIERELQSMQKQLNEARTTQKVVYIDKGDWNCTDGR